MPKPAEGSSQVNIVLPDDLLARVIKHQHQQELPSKTEAFRDLLERGLKSLEKEEVPKP